MQKPKMMFPNCNMTTSCACNRTVLSTVNKSFEPENATVKPGSAVLTVFNYCSPYASKVIHHHYFGGMGHITGLGLQQINWITVAFNLDEACMVRKCNSDGNSS